LELLVSVGAPFIRQHEIISGIADGGTIESCSMTELEDDRFAVFFTVSWRKDETVQLAVRYGDFPKIFSMLAVAHHSVRDDFGYTGSIVLTTERLLTAGSRTRRR
jgi:hypothetical protein